MLASPAYYLTPRSSEVSFPTHLTHGVKATFPLFTGSLVAGAHRISPEPLDIEKVTAWATPLLEWAIFYTTRNLAPLEHPAPPDDPVDLSQLMLAGDDQAAECLCLDLQSRTAPT